MKFKNVYIITPAATQAGGIESLFQLADSINRAGGNAITLFERRVNNPILPVYEHYKIKYAFEAEDTSDNLVICPEVWTQFLDKFKNIQKSIWWLSVNNNYGKFTDWSNNNIKHFYQSYYAKDHIVKNKAANYYDLFDYISDVYIKETVDISKKENIVCFNPVKGLEITKQIIKLNPDIKFVPIVDMNVQQVIDLLKKSKVYIDFGTHPGRDRIPRESTILGNCIITNTSGSAGFSEDIPIDNKFKITDVNSAGSVIKHCLYNFGEAFKEFSNYRSFIYEQRQVLDNQVKQHLI